MPALMDGGCQVRFLSAVPFSKERGHGQGFLSAGHRKWSAHHLLGGNNRNETTMGRGESGGGQGELGMGGPICFLLISRCVSGKFNSESSGSAKRVS